MWMTPLPGPARRMPNLVLTALLCAVLAGHSHALTRRHGDLADGKYKADVLWQIDSLLATKYVLPEEGKGFASAFEERYASGAYDGLTDPVEFAARITADLVEITGDRHTLFRVIEASDIGEDPVSALHHPVRFHRMRHRENRGFHELKWLEGGVGYVDLRRCWALSESKEMIDATMRFLSESYAVIIDLRDNPGGSGDMNAYLAAYFFEEPVQLSGWYYREEDFLEEFWTTAEVGGERMPDVPLFILTSGRTFSASEALAYDLQALGRAVLVGERTKGGAHSVDLFKIGDRFEIYLSTARAISPVTGGNWEGTGVIPDVPAPSASALDTAMVLAGEAARAYGEMKEAALEGAVEGMQAHLDRAERLYREGKLEAGGEALDSMFDAGGALGPLGEFFFDVLAYGYSMETDGRIVYAILEKNIELHPGSPAAWETLAHTYADGGMKLEAIGCFRKVLELDPGNRNAARMIERLEKE